MWSASILHVLSSMARYLCSASRRICKCFSAYTIISLTESVNLEKKTILDQVHYDPKGTVSSATYTRLRITKCIHDELFFESRKLSQNSKSLTNYALYHWRKSKDHLTTSSTILLVFLRNTKQITYFNLQMQFTLYFHLRSQCLLDFITPEHGIFPSEI